VVIFENHTFDQIIDPGRAPFIYDLGTSGALFVNSFAVAHPSQPNYFALFSGSTQAVRDNDHDHSFDVPSLASALNAAQNSFVGYIETGSPREHNPWESFNNVSGVERNLTELPNECQKNGNAPNLPLPINWQPGAIGRHKNPTLKSGARAS